MVLKQTKTTKNEKQMVSLNLTKNKEKFQVLFVKLIPKLLLLSVTKGAHKNCVTTVN